VLLVGWTLAPGSVPASIAPRALLILPFEAVALELDERWMGEGVAQSLAFAFAQHPAFVQVDQNRLKRFGQPELWGESVVLAAARSLKADVVLYGEIRRTAGGVMLRPRYLEVKAGGGEGRALEQVGVSAEQLLDVLPELSLAYFRSLRVTLAEKEAAKVEKAARPTASFRAFEMFVRGRMAAVGGTQDANEVAAELFGRAAEIDPNFVMAQYSLGLVHHALGNRWKAAAYFRASIQIDPTAPEPYKALGDLFMASPRRLHAQAMEAYQKALELRPFYAEASVGLGDATAAKGDSDGAIRHYQLALASNPLNPRVHVSLGKIYSAEKGLYYESVASYKRAIELDPQFLDARMGLGEVYEEKGLYPEAIEEYRQVVALDPKHTGALYNLALAYEKVAAKEAIVHWERYIAVASEMPSEKDWVDVARQHLRKLRNQVESDR
jgi:tetratricopeptide (TPR) repeat protein/TolB-like protein